MIGPEKEQVLGEKIREIVTQFRSRATNVKMRLEHPPTPESAASDEDDPVVVTANRRALQKLVFEVRA